MLNGFGQIKLTYTRSAPGGCDMAIGAKKTSQAKSQVNRLKNRLLCGVAAGLILSATPLSWQNASIIPHISSAMAAQESDQFDIRPFDIRMGRHDGYTRLVIDTQQSAASSAYILEQPNKERVNITFPKARAKISAIADPNLPENILALSVKDTAKDGIALTIPAGSDIRHFAIGDRVILDIYDPASGPVASKNTLTQPAAASPTKAPAAAPDKTKAQAEIKAKPAPHREVVQNDAYRVADNIPVPAPHIDVKDLASHAQPPISQAPQSHTPATDAIIDDHAYAISADHRLSLTGTHAMYLTVFTRGNYLWVAHNQPDNMVPPKIEGPDRAKFPDFDLFHFDNGIKAYRLIMPSNAYIDVAGDGLSWVINLRISEKDRPFISPVINRSGESNEVLSLSWDMPSAHHIAQIQDPIIGDDIIVIGVGKSRDAAGDPLQYNELSTLTSYAGLAFLPKTDDLDIALNDNGVVIGQENGLNISKGLEIKKAFLEGPETDDLNQNNATNATANNPQPAPDSRISNIYHFDRWALEGPRELKKNEALLLTTIAQSDDIGQTEGLISLGKLYIANNLGPEALGYLQYAQQTSPALKDNPEFLALQGAAHVLNNQYKDAYDQYSNADLDQYKDVDIWRAMVLAGLGDWGQAGRVLPKDTRLINDYPSPLREDVALSLAEIALRDGRKEQADQLLSLVKSSQDMLSMYQKAALDYLLGEAARQNEKFDEAVKIWTALSTGKDDLYRAKSGLALTALQQERGLISPDQAIDQLEQLRYGWRGDELEARNYKTLGDVYINNKNYLKGLAVLRRGAELSENPALSEDITKNMSSAFENLFLSDEIEKLSPLEAVGVYEKFHELTPTGARGDNVMRQLAERLISVGLLGRASDLLTDLIENRLIGMDAARTALRLASIQLLDDKPQDALSSLHMAEEYIAASKAPSNVLDRDIALLKARAYSNQGASSRAISTLSRITNQDADVYRLRADIAWRSGTWSEAARSLERLVALERISIQQQLDDRQADLILNWAVALNLAEDRRALANLRNRYGQAMSRSARARLFDVVTRERQNVRLADRNTLLEIVNEVDLFNDFLAGYPSGNNTN